MYDEAQTLYMSEVLGLNPDLLSPLQTPPPGITPDLLILCSGTSAAEQALLDKILASVPLPEHTLRLANLDELGAYNATKRILSFSGKNLREVQGDQVWWHLPELRQMLGQGVEVNSLKKLAWGLLQDLAGDLRG